MRRIGSAFQLLGVVAVADTIRDSARQAVAMLVAMLKSDGVQTVMPTGDKCKTAAAVAAQLGMDEVSAEVLPRTKRAKLGNFRPRAASGDGRRWRE